MTDKAIDTKIMNYLDNLRNPGSRPLAQFVADEFGLSPEVAEQVVGEWQKRQQRFKGHGLRDTRFNS